MQFRIIYFILLLILSIGCSKRLTLENELSCSRFISFSKTTQHTDINKNFKINIPNHWKHKLYFDDYQSAIFMADTIKPLKETYIIDTSFKYGELVLDESFKSKVDNANLTVLKSNFESFHEKSCYWQISKGEKNGFKYHLFNLFIKMSVDTYIEVKTEFYGEELVDERLCEAFAIINTLTVLK